MSSPLYCAVIEKNTGKLLRAGYSDMTADGSFDAVSEDMIATTAEAINYVWTGIATFEDRYWNGSTWQEDPLP